MPVELCPFVSISFEAKIDQFNERVQCFVLSKPHLTNPDQLHTEDSLMIYQGIVHQTIVQSLQDKPKVGVYREYFICSLWEVCQDGGRESIKATLDQSRPAPYRRLSDGRSRHCTPDHIAEFEGQSQGKLLQRIF